MAGRVERRERRGKKKERKKNQKEEQRLFLGIILLGGEE